MPVTVKRNPIRARCVEEAGDAHLVFADGFDDAVIGVADVGGYAVVVYDQELVVDALAASGMSYDDAREFFEFNVCQAYVGPQTPVFVRRVK